MQEQLSRECADPRESFVDGLLAIALEEPRLMVLDADVSRTSRTRRFRNAYPERFYDFGVAEQNMIGAAAGLAEAGCIPVAVTFAVFASMRCAEQVRTSVCYPNFNVKIVGGYAGLSNGKDGATHQSIEDVAIMRSFPNLIVMSPSDAVMAHKMAVAAVRYEGPVYIRLEYEEVPIIHPSDFTFDIGKGYVLRDGGDVTIAAYGLAMHRALEAAHALAESGIEAEVIDMPTLKPIDAELLLQSVSKTGALVTVEDHSTIGGLGSAATDVLVRSRLNPVFQSIGIGDTFTESGPSQEVRNKHGVGLSSIIDAARKGAMEVRKNAL